MQSRRKKEIISKFEKEPLNILTSNYTKMVFMEVANVEEVENVDLSYLPALRLSRCKLGLDRGVNLKDQKPSKTRVDYMTKFNIHFCYMTPVSLLLVDQFGKQYCSLYVESPKPIRKYCKECPLYRVG